MRKGANYVLGRSWDRFVLGGCNRILNRRNYLDRFSFGDGIIFGILGGIGLSILGSTLLEWEGIWKRVAEIITK